MIKSNRLTALGVEKKKAKTADIWLSDDEGTRGGGRLVIRISTSGSKLFYFRYSIDGVRKQHPIGPFTYEPQAGLFTLDQARDEFRIYSAMHRNPATRDVIAALKAIENEKRRAEAAELERHRLIAESASVASKYTLKALCSGYASHLEELKKVSAANVKSQFALYIDHSKWADMPAKDFTKKDATAFLRELVSQGKGYTAKRMRSYLQSAFNLAIRAESDASLSSDLVLFDIQANPIAPTASLSKFSKPRMRTLSEKEMGEVWKRLWAKGADADLAVKALRMSILLGGQRGLQLMRVRCIEDVDLAGRQITLYDPKGRRETARAHCLPLVGKAFDEVQSLMARSKALGSNWLFQGATKQLGADAMSAVVYEYRKEFMANEISEQQFQFSDLRRTAETMLAGLGVHKDVRAQLQSHGLSGIQDRHYDMHEYMEAKELALTAWHNHLDSIASGKVPDSNVKNFKRA